MDKIILAIESSCDETSIAILRNEELLANVISTQISIHQKYGGVMPEIASRLHIENIGVVLKEALETAKIMKNICVIYTKTLCAGITMSYTQKNRFLDRLGRRSLR